MYFFRLSKIGSSKTSNKVFGMAEVNGFCVLVTITAASTNFSITSTRPLSTVTMEEASTKKFLVTERFV